MFSMAADRKLELVALIEHVLKRTDLLQSESNRARNLAKTIWGHFTKLIHVSEQMHVGDEARKEQLYLFLRQMNGKEIKVNHGDLQKAIRFMQSREMQELSFQEIKFVISWFRRLMEGD